MKNNKKKGFTIVELVIVIAVIGILSAILIPTFVGVTKAANEAALRSNVANAYSMYAADAADGKVDGAAVETALKFLAQDKVVLTDTKSDSSIKGFQFTNNEWKVSGDGIPASFTVGANDSDYTLLADVSYNGYYVYATNANKAAA